MWRLVRSSLGLCWMTLLIAATVALAALVSGKNSSEPGRGTMRPPALSKSSNSVPTSSAGNPQPNIVWIVLDACRPENLSCYGYDRQTSPAIDRLARRGVLFENQFTQGLWTKLSVPSYMSGKYFPVSCLDSGGGRSAPREAPQDEKLFPEILKANGYHTVMVTAHGYMSPRSRLYKAFDEGFLVMTKDPKIAYVEFESLNEVVLPKIEELRGRPFFLYIHALDTHFPHLLKSPYDRWLVPDYSGESIRDGQPVARTGSQFSELDKQELRGMYDGGIARADDGIARLLHAFERQGLYENTIFLIGADHGEALGEDGTSWGHEVTFDQVLRVPCVMAGPGLPEGRRIAELTENSDIVPTLVDLLRLKTEARFDGTSLAALVRGESSAPVHEYVFTRMVEQDFDRPPTYILRDTEFKYVHNPILRPGEEDLYRVPDNVANRSLCTEQEGPALPLFRERVARQLAPLWESYARQPKLYIDLFFNADFVRDSLKPAESIKADTRDRPNETECSDGSWSFLDGALWASPWAEKVPELILSHEVPPGRYFASAYLIGFRDWMGHPGSSVRIKANGEQDFHLVKWRTEPGLDHDFNIEEFALYDLSSGVFQAAIGAGDPDCWTAIKGLRLTRAEAVEVRGNVADDHERQLEQLRALGYLNAGPDGTADSVP